MGVADARDAALAKNAITPLVGTRGSVRRAGRADRPSTRRKCDRQRHYRRRLVGELERAVRPVPVVYAQDVLEMPPSKDQDAIETVAADGAHPALSERV